ncbi:hypothetical protein PG997_010542 [Apiospora hydei]|uniref:Uncharacterized protein n=1 Tax=Apiospora hydei TaxID=1337664 RepID=A0ABR1VXB6_9PEZI
MDEQQQKQYQERYMRAQVEKAQALAVPVNKARLPDPLVPSTGELWQRGLLRPFSGLPGHSPTDTSRPPPPPARGLGQSGPASRPPGRVVAVRPAPIRGGGLHVFGFRERVLEGATPRRRPLRCTVRDRPGLVRSLRAVAARQRQAEDQRGPAGLVTSRCIWIYNSVSRVQLASRPPSRVLACWPSPVSQMRSASSITTKSVSPLPSTIPLSGSLSTEQTSPAPSHLPVPAPPPPNQ